MKRSEVEHVLRAAAAIAQEQAFVVVGSQAILLHYIGDVTAICPEIHDLAVSKCVAGREKDADFIRALLRHGMIEAETLLDRIALIDGTRYPVEAITAWARRRITEARP